MTILKPVGALFLIASGAVSVPERVPLPVEARKSLDRALELTGEAFLIGARDHPVIRVQKRGEAAAQLAATLDRLVAQLPAEACGRARESEGRDIESKLIAIACDKRDRPAVHAEIERVYVKGVHAKESRFPRSPELKVAHATEKYRLAWEFFLLSPEPEAASPLYDFRAGDALGRIRNSASLVTLGYSCKLASEKNLDSEIAERRQRLVLRTLNFFASQEALRAMLACLSHIQQLREAAPPSWDAEDYLYRLLTDQENYGNAAEWRTVLGAFPREGLPSEQRQLLERASKALEKSPPA